MQLSESVMAMNRLTRTAAVAVVLVSSFTILGVRSASAASACPAANDGYQMGISTEDYTGSGSQPHTYVGAAAYIKNVHGWDLCTTPAGHAPLVTSISAWVMWYAPLTRAGSAYLQAGYIKVTGDGSCVYRFIESYDSQLPAGSEDYQLIDRSECVTPNGQSERFIVKDVKSDNNTVEHMYAYTAGTLQHVTSYGATDFASPFVIQFRTETHNWQSDMPGTATTPMDYTSEEAQNSTNNTFSATTSSFIHLGITNQYPTKYGVSRSSDTHSATWTK